MITERIEELKYDTIEDLVQRQVPEGRVLDYKKELPDKTSDKTKEFLADVASFANAGGGHLVLGITTKKQAGRNTNLPDMISGVGEINVEQEVLRLESVIRDGIEPRIVGLRIRVLGDLDKPKVVIIHVPRSWNAPHMVARGTSKFFSRTSAGKQPLDVTEIRQAFSMSESTGERIRAFRKERIVKLYSNAPEMLLYEGAIVALHLIPLRAFTERSALDIRDLYGAASNLLLINSGDSQQKPTLNFDGVRLEAVQDFKVYGYLQMFRSGVIEVVDTITLNPKDGSRFILCPKDLEQRLIRTVNHSFWTLQKLGVEPPIAVFLSFGGVYGINIVDDTGCSGSVLIDRNSLLMPELLMEHVDVPTDVFLRPLFDLLWQSGGKFGSPYYSPDGRWGASQ